MKRIPKQGALFACTTLSLIALLSTASYCQARRVSLEGVGISIRYTDRTYRYKSDHLDTSSWDLGLIFPKSTIPAAVSGSNWEFATHDFRPASEDSRTNDVINRIKADATGDLLIAMPSPAAFGNGWVRLNASPNPDYYLDKIGRSTAPSPDPNSPYWFYTRSYTTPGTWVMLPTNSIATNRPPFVFARKGELYFENPPPLPGNGVIITAKPDGGNSTTVANPKLLIRPNGDYLASISGSAGTSATSLWKSTDRGVTWTLLEDGFYLNRDSIFEHQGSIFQIGLNTSGSGSTRIYKSSNNGATWITSVFAGIGGDDAPSHVDVVNGRIWKAAYAGGGPGFYSAPTNADLMQESSWTLSGPGTTYSEYTLANGQKFRSGNEGTLLTTREGVLVNLGKDQVYRPADGWKEGISLVQPKLNDLTKTTYDLDYAGPRLPGSGSKYTARYDPVSQRYWALTSVGSTRGELNLYSASSAGGSIGDFQFEQTILKAQSSSYQGFNYPFMLIDGDDIVFTLRTAWDHHRGTSDRWHDADLFTFHRIPNFRGAVAPGDVVNPGFEAGMTGWLTDGDTNADYVQTINPHSGTNNLAHYKNSAYQVNTYQTVTKPNGTYTASAWVKCSGGQSQCYFYVSGYGGAEIRTNILAGATYTQIIIPVVHVTSGVCKIGVHSDANAGNWVTVDDVELFAPPVPPSVWTNLSGGSWATAGNWSNNVIPNVANLTVDFSQLTLLSNLTVTLDGAKTAGHPAFGDVGNNYGWRLTNGTGGPLTLVGTPSPVITVNNGNATVGTVLAGTDGLIKAGDGTLTLAANNTYTGSTTVSAGILALDVPNDGQGALAWSGNLTINAGAAVRMDANNSLIGYNAPVGSLPVTINAGGTLTCLGTAQSGAGADGHLRGPLILQGGTLTTEGTGINTKFGTWDLDAGVVVDGEIDTSVIACRYVIPSQAGGTIFDVADGSTPSGVDLLVSGTLDDATSLHDSGIIKMGAGTMLLAGSNTYARPTIISEGTLLVNGSTAGGSVVTVQTNGTLGGTGTINGPVTFNAGSFAQVTLGSPLTLSSSLTMATEGAPPIVKLNLTNNVPPGTYTLATYNTAGSSGAFDSIPLITGGSMVAGATGSITAGGGFVSLVVTPPQSAPGFPADAIRVTDGTVSLLATGTIGNTYKLWATTNIALTPAFGTWSLLTNGTIAANPFSISDPGAVTNQRRFYRFSSP